MKTGRLRKATSFWKSIFFVGNICKMRKRLMKYLTEEGLKCDLVDGDVVFEFNDCHFCTKKEDAEPDLNQVAAKA